MMEDASTILAAKAAERSAYPLMLIEENGNILWSNQAAQEWLSTSLIGQNISETAIPPSVAESLNALVLQVFTEGRDKIVLSESLGLSGVCDLNFQLDLEENRVCLSVFPRTDVSSASHDSALGFGRMLAHELKNPLASARGAAQLIQRESSLDQAHDFAGDIINDIDRMTRLADHWSRVGDIQLGQIMPANLNRVAVSAAESFRRGIKGDAVEIEYRFDPSLPELNADGDLLHQAVLNLLQNAYEASPDGESIILETRFDTSARSRAGPIATPLVVSVTDCGEGISKDLGAGIFTPFVTTKPAGEGLGLAFSSRIASLHKGVLDYESEPGHTCFSLRLPLDETGSEE